MSRIRKKKKAISAVLAAALAIGLISPLGGDTFGAEEKAESIINFESSGVIYEGEVTLGDEPDLPDKLKVVASLEDEEEQDFQYAEPTNVDRRGYNYYSIGENLYAKVYDEGSDITQGVKDGIIFESGNSGTSYRVFGSLNGSDNMWYAADSEGTLLGKIVEIDAAWDTTALEAVGEYSLTLTPESIGEYECEIELPSVKVTVKEPEASEEDSEEDSEEEFGSGLIIKPMATEHTEGNLVYSLDEANFTAVVLRHVNAVPDGTGGYDNSAVAGAISIPQTVTFSSRSFTVMAINDSAFRNSGITGLSMPNTITIIGNQAFEGCGSLVNSLVLPAGLEVIGNMAFRNCTRLTGVLNLPAGLTVLGPNAFENCSTLTGGLTIPAGITSIGAETFKNCSNLDGTLVLHDGITFVGREAFLECSGLDGGIRLMNPTITTIGESAFALCDGLTGSLELSNSITTIGPHAFEWCMSLSGSINLPNNLTTIGQYAFFSCEKLTGPLVIPTGVTALPNNVFQACAGISSITFNNVTTIGDSAFSTCVGLSGNLNIPNGVTSIGHAAFEKCTGLNGTISLPNTLTYIGNSAFSECVGLTGTLTIPDSVTFVGGYAYYNCIGLSKIEHKKIASVSGQLEELSNFIYHTPDLTGYENTLDTGTATDPMKLTKSVKWDDSDTSLETAEILLTYEEQRSTAYDVIFVMSQSNTMINDTATAASGGTTYEYPASLLMEDIVMDAIDIVLEGNTRTGSRIPYTNRVGIVGLRGGSAVGTSFTTGTLTDNAATAKNIITDNPLVDGGSFTTSYSLALESAEDMINDSIDSGAIPVVIFLSDGSNADADNTAAEAAAESLRDMGAVVQPMLLFNDAEPGNDLRALSFDENTLHRGENTTSFQDAMETVIEQMGKIIYLKKVEDSLSGIFDFATSGGAEVISVSTDGGTYTVSGDKVTWDLMGCDVEKAHTMTITLDLDIDTNNITGTTGKLKTNSALVSALNKINEDSTNQPTIERYIATYQFKDGNGATLSPSVESAIRADANYKSYTGGYKDATTVTPWTPANATITVGSDVYEFKGWDEATKTVDEDNLSFTGTWELLVDAVNAQFTKVDSNTTTGLGGAQFKLYEYTCTDSSHNHITDSTDVVDVSSPGPCWTSMLESDGITEKIFTSSASGVVSLGDLDDNYYMLVEVKAPDGYEIPVGQWMIEADSSKGNTGAGDYQLNFVAKTASIMPNAIIRDTNLTDVSYKVVNTKPMKLPLSGFDGINVYVLGGILIMLLSLGVYLYDQKKRRKSL